MGSTDRRTAMRRREMIGAMGLAWLSAGFAVARTPQQSAAAVAREHQLREDFPNLARYAADNARIAGSGCAATSFPPDGYVAGSADRPRRRCCCE